MSRISLKEDYDNKDVIQQVYDLKDKTAEATRVSQEASKDAKEALGGIAGAISDASNALKIAGEAKESASVADSKAVSAQTTADTAKATAEANVRSASIETDASSGTLVLVDALGHETRVAVNIASGAKAGLMNAQTFAGLTNLGVRVSALEGRATTAYVVFASDNPGQAEITSAFQTSQGRAPVAGDYATDIARSLTYGFNGTAWVKVSQDKSIPQFSAGAFGVIKGGDPSKDGTVIAEPDGSGSVQGWDVVKTSISNNADGIVQVNGRVDGVEDELVSYQLKVSGSEVVIPLSGWNPEQLNVVNVVGVTPQSIVWVSPTADFQELYGRCGVSAILQGDGTLTFRYLKKPDGDMTVNVVVA